MNEDEKEFLQKLGKKIDKLIDREFDKIGWDRAYFDFKILVRVHGMDFVSISDEIVLLDYRKTFCEFCGKPTLYYDHETGFFLCPKCLRELKEGEGK